MTYKVYDKASGEDITDKYDWAISPDGTLYHNDFGDHIGIQEAVYVPSIEQDSNIERNL